jgi:hypothetical protein
MTDGRERAAQPEDITRLAAVQAFEHSFAAGRDAGRWLR